MGADVWELEFPAALAVVREFELNDLFTRIDDPDWSDARHAEREGEHLAPDHGSGCLARPRDELLFVGIAWHKLGGLQAGFVADWAGAPISVGVGAAVSLLYRAFVALRYLQVRVLACNHLTKDIPMKTYSVLNDPAAFSSELFEIMKCINPALEDLEPYEFRYCLNNLIPEPGGWASVKLDSQEEIERRVNDTAFFKSIQIKAKVDDRIILDPQIVNLTNMLFVGLITGAYLLEWMTAHFYFDVRGFFFLRRTTYFTEEVLAHLGGKPYRQFEQKQKAFEYLQDVGYKAVRDANAEIDEIFIDSVKTLIASRGTPILLAIAGPTAAGKTEIVERLRQTFEQEGQKMAAIEMDNFLTDRDHREAKGIHTQGAQALHFELLKKSLENITQGKKISIPRYDFIYATSSHDLEGNLKPDGDPIEIEPADIIFIEGNFPFLLEEVAQLISIKVVYLTDDPIRLKRKWKRDIDYRKKYEPTYFRNRYFKDQFIMADFAYRPQMAMADMVVDTTGAALWTTAEIAEILNGAE